MVIHCLLGCKTPNSTASVAQLDARPTQVIRRMQVPPQLGRQHSFVEIDHEIFPTVILSLSLIQGGQLSVSGERMCTMLVNCLEDYAGPVSPFGLTGP